MQNEKTVREQMIDKLATQVFLAVFADAEGETLDKIIDRILKAEEVPGEMKAEVFEKCKAALEKLLLELAKKMPEGRPLQGGVSE